MVEIGDLLAHTRFTPGFKFGLMVLYFPIGVFLIVCRILIALHAYMILCFMPRTAAKRQFVRAMLGVLGIHIWVDEAPGTAAVTQKLLVANFTSVLDHIVADVVISHFVPYHGDVPKMFQWVLGYKDLGYSQGKTKFIQNCKAFIQENKLPILIQPESRPTNNSIGLLKFDTLAFEFELPVQPVSIHLSSLSFPCAITTIESPKWTDVLWCFFNPVTVYKLKSHPIMAQDEEESIEDYAERVRAVFAETLNLEKTEFTAADVAEYRKRLNRTRNQTQRVKPYTVPPVPTTSCNNTGSCLDTVDAELSRMIQQVKDVLPQVPVMAVKQDLEQTKDVDVTISNILEGRVEYNTEEEAVTRTPSSTTCVLDKDVVLFKASTFPRNSSDRHLSLAERKELMYETARLRYKEKHGLL